LSDVDDALRGALKGAGYFSANYYIVPGGFALVTPMERIGGDASKKPEPERWHLSPMSDDDFSLMDYIRALFSATNGYYRVLVFAVTSDAFSQERTPVSYDRAGSWSDGGLNRLPRTIASERYTEEHACVALVYVFRRPPSGETPALVASHYTARTHLRRAGLWSFME